VRREGKTKMNNLIDQPPPALAFQTAQNVRRSCRNCDYIGDVPGVKCPRCGRIPLVSLSKLKTKGAVKIAQGILTIAVLSVAPIAVSKFSLFERTTFIRDLFRGDMLLLLLVLWATLLALFAGACEIIAGFWLIFYAKPNRTIKTLKPILYALCVVTGLIFVILNKINGYD